VRGIRKAGIIPSLPIEVVVFASEEAPRFHQAAHHFGSRAMAGTMDLDRLDALTDDDNVSVAEALRRWGLDPRKVSAAQRQPGEIRAAVEMHMEQGRILRDRGQAVGVVTTITGVGRYWLTLHGSADHSGATPMPLRHDALAGAAEVILAVERHAVQLGDSLVSTVGVIRAFPGSISIVPGEVRIGIDIRDVDAIQLKAAEARLRQTIEEVCSRRHLRSELETISEDEPTPMSESVRTTIRQACQQLGVPAEDVPSHSGHDTGSIAPITPVGMIFVRNVSGKSHSPDEFVALDDIAAGSRVLAATLVMLADASWTA
jgi:hydantoinase/carbamoylase family amidase